MWYHWLILAIAAWQVTSIIYEFVKGPASSTGSKVFRGIMLAVWAYALMWAWGAAMAPAVPVAMGGRRR
jgi:hypothetical protein